MHNSEDSNYLKDVESYFLSLAGAGVMLSSIDYGIISDWKKRGVMKELVLRGIGLAFKSSTRAGTKPVRNIKQCVSFVESCVSDYRSTSGETGGVEIKEGGQPKSSILADALDAIGKNIADGKNAALREYYKSLKARVLTLEESEDIYLKALRLEDDCLEKFYNSLPEPDRVDIIREAEGKVQGRARRMTDKAYRESVRSFRNDVIRLRYGVKQFF